jgi:hypothetical protein
MARRARTPAERQAAYRKARPTVGENGERRINTWVTTRAALALARLARHHDLTQRQMLERLITTADDKITGRLDPASDAWEEYFSVTA